MPESMEPNPQFAQLASDARLKNAVAALTANGMDALVVSTGAEAKEEVLKRLPPGGQVFTMQSQTLKAIGLAEAIDESGHYESVRQKLTAMDTATQAKEKRILGATPDWAVGSVHAVTEDGHLFIASNTGSQLSAYVSGAAHVIFVVGSQKLVQNDVQAGQRLPEYSLPLEDQRLFQAHGFHSGISKILTITRERIPGRITVVLVKEKLGF
ncbi:MAG: LUD domain-containing protein [Candidatus Kerfeldbacteria bacterium]|nr:LUD domain-containing protein [Candidatus Kerfeldbacteria bacterium]